MKGYSTTMNTKLIVALSVAALVLLPGCGCDWIKDKFGTNKNADMTINAEDVLDGESLVSMGGKTIISAKSLDRDFEQLLEENPQLKSVLPLMPDAKYNFLQGMVSQAVVDRYVVDKKIDQTAQYQEDLVRMTRSVKRMLNTKYFSLEHTMDVTDADITKFYEENKNTMPDLLISRGGVKAAGVQFNSEESARSFATKAKGHDFAKVAKEAGLTDKVRDFKLVNSQSVGLDNAVKNKIIGMKKFPAVEVVKGDDKNFWVVNATESQETKYRPLEQVKAGLKQYIEKEKRMAVFDKEIGKLKEEYKVAINDDFFKNNAVQLPDEVNTAPATTVAQPATKVDAAQAA